MSTDQAPSKRVRPYGFWNEHEESLKVIKEQKSLSDLCIRTQQELNDVNAKLRERDEELARTRALNKSAADGFSVERNALCKATLHIQDLLSKTEPAAQLQSDVMTALTAQEQCFARWIQFFLTEASVQEERHSKNMDEVRARVADGTASLITSSERNLRTLQDTVTRQHRQVLSVLDDLKFKHAGAMKAAKQQQQSLQVQLDEAQAKHQVQVRDLQQRRRQTVAERNAEVRVAAAALADVKRLTASEARLKAALLRKQAEICSLRTRLGDPLPDPNEDAELLDPTDGLAQRDVCP